MGAIKGCINKKCLANKKKIVYKKSDEFCSKCGEKLQYVCKNKKCRKQLPNSSEKYCPICLAERKDKKDKVADVGVKGVVGGVGLVALCVSVKDVVKSVWKR